MFGNILLTCLIYSYSFFKTVDGEDLSSKLLKSNGLPHIRFHELRHSCASMLLNEGFTLKDVQIYMGHADISMTADIYGHLDVARKDILTRNIAASIFQ